MGGWGEEGKEEEKALIRIIALCDRHYQLGGAQ